MSVELLFDSDLIESLLCRAGQDSHSQDRHLPFSCPDRGANHFASSAEMNRQHLDAEISRGFNGFCDRVWNIVQFEIEKNFCAGSADSTHNLGTFGGVELEAD